MTRTWYISGARRGVGKTYLAKHLCAVLPTSIYVKCGRGRPRSGKSANYFRTKGELNAFIAKCDGSYENVVIEANTYTQRKPGNINIFLDARSTANDIRTDADNLKKNADICVSSGESRSDWEAVLEAHVNNPALIDAVLDILSEQQRWISSSSLKVRSKIWFVNSEGDHVFGSGLAQLLVEVEHLGSLNAAAKRIKISNQNAKQAVEKAEKHFGHQLIHPGPGGDEAGGSKLTPAGKRMVALYIRLSEKTAAFVDEVFDEAIAEELGNIKELP
ncbi:MAG: LysR family transcriptional regulator [Candidatus Latescibacteria bacterium]|nr:LysR family transcriptional regulator [Candidatus Latescibacterota bacterium]NIM66320.1 LysR family transcriptional regulator [Candidatus Latescibacterota bacterium]NIO02799.1 LysR family transcriptional regulator [Candidatus Latescibacterota bacterium]NIO29934.1 LysR family transcriptional regulator [Candidatus Latescibacterota bacterium]NIO57549.1 LysR family transcriptional regulator [Candidatus Latescibacterota bacterium]